MIPNTGRIHDILFRGLFPFKHTVEKWKVLWRHSVQLVIGHDNHHTIAKWAQARSGGVTSGFLGRALYSSNTMPG